MVPRILLGLCVYAVAILPGALAAQVRDSSRNASGASSISGIVKDEYGEPLPRAEVRVEPGGYGEVTDATGKFRIQAPPGSYNVVFRHLGYGPEDFSWRARPGEGTELSIRLNPLPQNLDTVVVRDSHNNVAGKSSIKGLVVDSAMRPLKDVQIQLIGTGHHATSYESGKFFFAGLAQGTYVLRARLLGFSPENVTVKVGTGEEHDLSVILTSLTTTLATVEIREKSGFGTSASAWEEFDRRARWKSNQTVTIGRDVFGRLGKEPLDWALQGTPAASLVRMQVGGGKVPTSINSGNSGGLKLDALTPVPGNVCILVDGVSPESVPLSAFKANEVERVEVIASGGDWTGTVGDRMALVKGCAPGASRFDHPTYFVVWTRGST